MKFTQPIAIVGIGGVFPGALDLDTFWNNLKHGISVSKEIPSGRWSLSIEDAYAPPPEKPDKAYSSKGCFIEDFDIDEQINLKELDIDQALVEKLDPLCHLTLAAGVRAFNEAITEDIDKKRIGIIIGNIALPTDKSSEISDEIVGKAFEKKVLGDRFDEMRLNPSEKTLEKTSEKTSEKTLEKTSEKTDPLNRYVTGLPAGILAKVLKLGGGTYALDAACSSSLYAIKLACDELLSGKADAMIAGGVSRPDRLYTQMGFSQLKALSPDGVCAPFDYKANGLVMGEGAGLFVLKRLDDALESGDKIYAVIKGIGLSNDRAGNLLAPDSEGQLRAMEQAYEQTGWRPEDVDIIECHGTGTPVGDAVEVKSLKKLWEDSGSKPGQCVIGSVKSNIGHLLTGAGGAGLMKIILAMNAKILPPTANFRSPAREMGLEDSPFKVLSEAQPWLRRKVDGDSKENIIPRRAAISGFGFGGTNAHVLIEEWDGNELQEKEDLQASSQDSNVQIAVIGMGAHFGPWDSLDSFTSRVLYGINKADPGPKQNWFGIDADFKGYPIDSLKIPLGRFKIPPKELEEMLPQQLLMLKVADAALEDAGIRKNNKESDDSYDHLNSGCFIGVGLDFSTTNFHVRWNIINKYKDWAGLLGIEATPELLRSMRDAFGPALNANRTMGALASIAASRIAREYAFGGPSFTISSEESSGISALRAAVNTLQNKDIDLALVGAVDLAGDIRSLMNTRYSKDSFFCEGAGAVVLKRLEDAEKDGDRIYSVIGGIEVENKGMQELEAGSEIKNQETGFAGAASSFASLIKSILILYHRVIPGKEQYWLTNKTDGRRFVAMNSSSVDGNVAKVMIEEYPLTQSDKTLDRQHMVESFNRRSGMLNPSTATSKMKTMGKIAFVFPGSGNHYPEMGKEICYLFPEILNRQSKENMFLRSQILPEKFWNKDAKPGLKDCIFGQVTFGTIMSDLMQMFSIKPDAVIGYSLGESAGLFSLRAWQFRDEMLKRTNESTLFNGELTSPFIAAQKTWDTDEADWLVGVVTLSAEKVKKALNDNAKSKRVYLLNINTPEECVIGGYPEDVRNFVSEVKCGFIEVPGVTIAHCEVLKPVEKKYWDLHHFKVTPPEGIDYYSGSWGKKYELSDKSAADSILAHALHGVDFPKTINAAYEDGIRYFIEIGPGNSCTRMIKKILKDKPHFASSASIPGEDEVESVIRLLAELKAEGFDVDVRWLGKKRNKMIGDEIIIPVGGKGFAMPAVDTHNVADNDLSSAVSDPAAQIHPAVAASAETASQAATTAAAFTQNDLHDGNNAAAHINAHETLRGFENAYLSALQTHSTYLNLSRQITETVVQNIAMQKSLMNGEVDEAADIDITPQQVEEIEISPPEEVPRSLNYEQCMEFAVGKIGDVLGPKFAEIDKHPTRVRLPDVPMMFVDRIIDIEGEPLSMTSGRIVTEHDVLHDGWYLDGGRMPVCDAVEAGQADLFLSGYLGIDFITKGRAVYRLLDATVCFHDHLPKPGDTIRYDIRIKHFFQQADTYLFRFEFDGTVDERPVITMRDGCAGFFTQKELDAGQGIILTALDKKPVPRSLPADWIEFVPMKEESFSDEQINALRKGDLVACFGNGFAGLDIKNLYTLPGGDEKTRKMKMIDRVTKLDPKGGRFGLGTITAEQDIHPDDWFLTCHFCDDNVMPGTLMYECCLHAFRVFLMRLGWVAPDDGDTVWEPIPGIASSLKCRGQVIESTKKAAYEIIVKELGYNSESEPYAIADALMYADGKMVVAMDNMSVKLTGSSREKLMNIWKNKSSTCVGSEIPKKPAIYDDNKILAFSIGNPSEAFGAPYKVFDKERVIARLPGPPYKFLNRITEINAERWKVQAGGDIEAQYDIPVNEWYFGSDGQGYVPFAVLLEIALQPCGWYSAFMGSALTSDKDLHYRNLGGRAILNEIVLPTAGTLTIKVKSTNVSSSAGMIIQHFEFDVWNKSRSIYKGTTYFGFFSDESLANQIGIRDAKIYKPTQAEVSRAEKTAKTSGIIAFPTGYPFPDEMLRMIDNVESFVPDGGPNGLGYIRGSMKVRPESWFFKAHFYQDPVIPGSLGLESMIQLMKYVAFERWGCSDDQRLVTLVPGIEHEWIYRGQVIPKDNLVIVDAWITSIDDKDHVMTADGFLTVDGRVIYQMNDFSIRLEDRAYKKAERGEE